MGGRKAAAYQPLLSAPSIDGHDNRSSRYDGRVGGGHRPSNTLSLNSDHTNKDDSEDRYELLVQHTTVSWTLRFLFFLCGVSTFARSEVVLMQTQMYAECFGLGEYFYALASISIFMPGILVQMLQSKFDARLDQHFGTARSATWRIMLAYLVSLTALIVLVIMTRVNTNLQSSAPFVYFLLSIMGLGISVSFGTYTQIVSMFPPELHPLFFFGTYAPFFVFAPVNIAVGNLCEKNNDVWSLRWDSIDIYYTVGVALSIAGVLSFLGVVRYPKSRLLFDRKDAELRARSHHRFVIPVEQDNLEDSTGAQLNLSVARKAVFDELSLHLRDYLRLLWQESLTQVLVTICSTLLAALYIDFKPTHFENLPTILMYDYYICTSLGVVMTSWLPFRRLFTPSRILILAALRLALVPFAVMAIRGIIGTNDYVLLAINSVQMWLAGIIFSLSFSLASDKFRSKPARTRASTIMNVVYYVAMAIGMGVSFALH